MASSVNFYADFKGLAALKNDASAQDPKALREAARQFESLFTQMMLKNMRDASRSLRSSDSLTESDQSDFYREMFDNQMAAQMSKGKGLGLADMLVKQLQSAGVESSDKGRETSQNSLIGHHGLTETATLARKFAPPSNAPFSLKATNVVKSKFEPSEQILKHSPPTNAPLTTNVALEAAITQANATIAEDGEVRVWCGNSDDAVEPIAANDSDASSLTRLSSLVSRRDSALTNPESPIPSPEPTAVDKGLRDSIATSPGDFVAQLWPHAKAAAEELGVDPRMLIAHAALETGWGKSIPCNPDGTCSFNLFGIKAGSRWQGPAVGVNTLEFEGGVAVQRRASFRAYDSPADSFRDYASLIKNSPRYAAVLGRGNDAAAFANALQQGGYATDPNYANKLTAVAERLRVPFKIDPSQPLALGRRVTTGGET
jgi:flagellar protein FlgJ